MVLKFSTSIPYFAVLSAVFGFADSREVVYAFTGDFAFTLRAKATTWWLRRVPVLRCEVRFLGLPIEV